MQLKLKQPVLGTSPLGYPCMIPSYKYNYGQCPVEEFKPKVEYWAKEVKEAQVYLDKVKITKPYTLSDEECVVAFNVVLEFYLGSVPKKVDSCDCPNKKPIDGSTLGFMLKDKMPHLPIQHGIPEILVKKAQAYCEGWEGRKYPIAYTPFGVYIVNVTGMGQRIDSFTTFRTEEQLEEE